MQLSIGLLLLVLSIGTSQPLAEEIGDKKLTVTLFYESYCPDCIDDITNNLHKAWTSFKGRGVLFDLVPFGNAQQRYVDDHWEFECQHGPKECLGNKLHACAMSQACGDAGTTGCAVDKLGHVMDFIYCLVQAEDQLRATRKCAKKTSLDGSDIVSCANGSQGDVLLNRYGNQTLAFRPKIQYVPTIAINGKHDVQAETDLTSEICKLRPKLCQTPEVISV